MRITHAIVAFSGAIFYFCPFFPLKIMHFPNGFMVGWKLWSLCAAADSIMINIYNMPKEKGLSKKYCIQDYLLGRLNFRTLLHTSVNTSIFLHLFAKSCILLHHFALSCIQIQTFAPFCTLLHPSTRPPK